MGKKIKLIILDIKMTLRYAKLAPDSGKQSVKDLYNI